MLNITSQPFTLEQCVPLGLALIISLALVVAFSGEKKGSTAPAPTLQAMPRQGPLVGSIRNSGHIGLVGNDLSNSTFAKGLY